MHPKVTDVMAAACMAVTDSEWIARLPDTGRMRNGFVVRLVYRNPFNQALRVARGLIIEIRSHAEGLKNALSERTAAITYTFA